MVVTNLLYKLIAEHVVSELENDFSDLENQVRESIISSTYLSFDPDTELDAAEQAIEHVLYYAKSAIQQ